MILLSFRKGWKILCLGVVFTSCVAASHYPHFTGIARIKEYTFRSEQIPPAFDGFRIAFLADFHYKSTFKEKQLQSCVRALHYLQPDAVFLGGDYQEGCQYIKPLFQQLSRYIAPYGTYAVLGNNDIERCTDTLRAVMRQHGIRLLEQEVDTITKKGQHLLVAGILNPFDLKHYGKSPTLSLHEKDYVILLSHTPDYAEDVPITNTDLVLAGHTHGGQVKLFRFFVPATGSKYGKKFLSGLNYTSSGIPVVTTNGLGTSRKKVRFCSPSEIVVVHLESIKKGGK